MSMKLIASSNDVDNTDYRIDLNSSRLDPAATRDLIKASGLPISDVRLKTGSPGKVISFTAADGDSAKQVLDFVKTIARVVKNSKVEAAAQKPEKKEPAIVDIFSGAKRVTQTGTPMTAVHDGVEMTFTKAA